MEKKENHPVEHIFKKMYLTGSKYSLSKLKE